MIPAIALMIAAYGSARLLNDCLARTKQTTTGATVLMVVISIGAILVLWSLAFMVNAAGASTGLAGP